MASVGRERAVAWLKLQSEEEVVVEDRGVAAAAAGGGDWSIKLDSD